MAHERGGLWARRELSGVQLVISDAHEGLRRALSQVFAGLPGAVPKLHLPAVLA